MIRELAFSVCTGLVALCLLGCQSSQQPPADGLGVRTSPDGALLLDRSFGHSHNDYYRDRPLFEALEAQMLSIEADVFLRGNDLLIAHDTDEIVPGKSLRSLYLDPLMEAFASFGGTDPEHPFGGRVRASGLPVVLMVDFKTSGGPAWRVLEAQLADYPGLVRVVRKQDDGPPIVEQGPVIVVVSGSRPQQMIIDAAVRRSAIDGRYPLDKGSGRPAHLMPMISTSSKAFLQRVMQNESYSFDEELVEFARHAAQQGRLARVWAMPDTEQAWDQFESAGMQLINTDQPSRLSVFLLESNSATSSGVAE